MTSNRHVIDALRPIGLEELVERAALLRRCDRKYVLPTPDLPAVLGALGDVQVLEIDNRREFAYRSVYFDTPELDSYLAAARGRRRRFKIRLRSYVDTDGHFLEVKTRDGRGATVKQRIPYAGAHHQLDSQAREYVDAVLAGAGVWGERSRFEPALVTTYRRTTLFVPSTGSRVTVDTSLAWALPGEPAVETPHVAVVETKSQRAASDTDRLLWSLKHRPCSVSKYGTGLAALRPELPANRWHPVLRRQLRELTAGQRRHGLGRATATTTTTATATATTPDVATDTTQETWS